MSKRSYTTQLSKLLRGIYQVPAALDTVVSGLAIDSRLVKKGDLFVALSGSKSSSTDHIKEAIHRGANAIVAEGSLHDGKVFEDENVIELFVDDLRSKVGAIADRYYQSPSQEMVVVGVTGTNGKTSVANYLAMYTGFSGKKSGTIGTLGYGIYEGSKQDVVSTGHTTPNVVETHAILAGFRDQGVKFVAIEVSSHGLDQGRVDEVAFNGAVFTNLTHEHLDYHGTMEAYAAAKRKLFEKNSLEFAVVNQDDPYAEYMLAAVNADCKKLGYAIKSAAEVSVLSSEIVAGGNSAVIKAPIGQVAVKSELIGEFNLSNLMAVLTVAMATNDLDKLEDRLSRVRPVSGRLEVVSEPGLPTAVVDYAHTPDALKSVLEAVKPYCFGNLNLVFGCGGERDKAKRQEMARIAEKAADSIHVTDDNPRNEDPGLIVQDILKGFTSTEKVIVEHDRKEAIRHAFANAKEGDLVLVAGKGHETWQEIAGEKSYFSDIEEVRKVLGINRSSAEECSS